MRLSVYCDDNITAGLGSVSTLAAGQFNTIAITHRGCVEHHQVGGGLHDIWQGGGLWVLNKVSSNEDMSQRKALWLIKNDDLASNRVASDNKWVA